jgi:hypothetical protein
VSGTNAATSAGFLGTDDVATIRMQNLATDIRGFIVCQEHVARGDRFTPNSGHEMAIRDLPSLSVALEPKCPICPQKQTSDDGVGMSHKPTFFGDTPTLLPLLMVGCRGAPD